MNNLKLLIENVFSSGVGLATISLIGAVVFVIIVFKNLKLEKISLTKGMLVRFLIKVSVFSSLSVMQLMGTYTVVPPSSLVVFAHFLLPVGILLIFLPEVMEIFDLQKRINYILFRIFKIITGFITALPLVLIAKITYIEYTWSDQVSLRFGFKLLRKWTAEEKLEFIGKFLDPFNVMAGNLINQEEKITLANQALSISGLKTDFLNLLHEKQSLILMAAEANKKTALDELITQILEFMSKYDVEICLGLALITTAFFFGYHWRDFFPSYPNNDGFTSSVFSIKDIAQLYEIVDRDHQILMNVSISQRNIEDAIELQKLVIDELVRFSEITPDEVAVLKKLAYDISQKTVEFCKCALSSKAKMDGK